MEVTFWEINSGNSPVLEFINKQTPKAAAKIFWVVEHFETRGMRLLGTSDWLQKVKPYKYLYELRVDARKIFYRILVIIKGAKAWLVHAFKKKTNKTPESEIRIALTRQSEIFNSLGIVF